MRNSGSIIEAAAGAAATKAARVVALSCLAVFPAFAASADPISISILHTNDVHSHFESDKSAMQLGGLARLRTAIRNARAATPDSLLVDGGDWAEGEIYYSEGAGAESLKLMDLMGYDAAVVGNHDWLNGPKRLVGAIQSARPRMTMIGGNFDMNGYEPAEDFYAAISPFAVKQVHGIKIAFVGIACSDPVYGSYLAPIKVTDPAPYAEKLALMIKSQHLADIVIGVSHNGIGTNQDLLKAAPNLDLVIGAHDHARLLHPVVVQRPGHPDAWVVEAGHWGQYLGQVDMKVTPGVGGAPVSLAFSGYKLTQVDGTIAEDAEVKARIEALQARIESKMGPIFHDHVADAEDEITGEGIENQMGDLVTDAYRKATGADIAIDQNKLIYDGLHRGNITSADVFNALPPIYDMNTGKAWTLHTWTMSGSTLATVFRLMYTWRKLTDMGGLCLSGIEVLYDPNAQKASLGAGDLLNGIFGSHSDSPVHELTVDGHPIDPDKTYKIAASAGIIQGIQVLNDKYYGAISLHDHVDTGIEDWRAVRDYLRGLSPLNSDKTPVVGRIRTFQADLGIVPGSYKWTPTSSLPDGSVTATVELEVTNFGGSPSPDDATVDLSSDANGLNTALDSVWTNRGAAQKIPVLSPGGTRTFVWDWVVVPGKNGIHPLSAYIRTHGENNSSNDGLTRYFKE